MPKGAEVTPHTSSSPIPDQAMFSSFEYKFSSGDLALVLPLAEVRPFGSVVFVFAWPLVVFDSAMYSSFCSDSHVHMVEVLASTAWANWHSACVPLRKSSLIGQIETGGLSQTITRSQRSVNTSTCGPQWNRPKTITVQTDVGTLLYTVCRGLARLPFAVNSPVY